MLPEGYTAGYIVVKEEEAETATELIPDVAVCPKMEASPE